MSKGTSNETWPTIGFTAKGFIKIYAKVEEFPRRVDITEYGHSSETHNSLMKELLSLTSTYSLHIKLRAI